MAINTAQRMTSIVFIDGSLADLQAILSGLDPSVTAIVLDPTQNGIQQMADALAGVSGLDSIHIISHGGSGQLNLGATNLSQDTLAQYQTQLATIGNALSATGDLLLYGCNIAQGAQGQAFISALATATGADVAASTDLTGNALLGGNWTLEASMGGYSIADANQKYLPKCELAHSTKNRRPCSMHGYTVSREARINSVLSFPRKREPSQIKHLDPRLRGDDELICVSLGSL